MGNKIRVAVAGIGFIGTVHIEQLRRLPNVEVVALASHRNAEQKARALGVEAAYSDMDALLEHEKIDAIHLCTPNNFHYAEAMDALRKGVHVICEKPMAMNLQAAEAMLELAEKSNLVHAVNFNYRFYPMAYEMRQRRLNGELGSVFSVHGSYLQDWLFLKTDYNWRLETELSGVSRAFADIGSHWADLLTFVTGLRVTEVLADFATFHLERKKPKKAIDTYSNMILNVEDYESARIDTEDYAAVLFHLENGAHASCVIHQAFAGKKNELILSVAGEKSSMTWDSSQSNHLAVGYRNQANQIYEKDPSILSLPTRAISSYPGGHVEGFADSMKQHFRIIYEAIETGDRNLGDYATFRDGLAEVKLCDRIVQSAKERSWIEV